MTIGVGILLAAVGAVLAFAVTGEVSGVDVQTIGVIMLIAGCVIAFVALIATMSRRRAVGTAPAGYRTTAPATGVVVDQGPVDSAQI